MGFWQAFINRFMSPQTALSAMVRVVSKFRFRSSPRVFSFLQINERAKPYGLAVPANTGDPTLCPSIPLNAVNARYVSLLQPQVPVAGSVIDLSQISNPVVVPFAIYVVNDFRPSTMRDSPSYTVGSERAPAEGSKQVSVLAAGRESGLVSTPGVPLLASHCGAFSGRRRKIGFGSLAPEQFAGLGPVFDAIAQIGNVGQRMLSHVVSPYVRGQGRALLTQRFRPAFHSAAAPY